MTDNDHKISIAKFAELIKSLSEEPIMASVFFLIARHPQITAKELKKKYLHLKGTSIYYYLRRLVDNKLLITKSEPVKNKNLLQKRYHVNYELFSEELFPAVQSGKDKNMNLFMLFAIQNAINDKIQEIVDMTQENFEKYASKYDPRIISVFSLSNSSLSDDLKKKIDEIHKLLSQESKKQLGELIVDKLKGTSLIFIGNIETND